MELHVTTYWQPYPLLGKRGCQPLEASRPVAGTAPARTTSSGLDGTYRSIGIHLMGFRIEWHLNSEFDTY